MGRLSENPGGAGLHTMVLPQEGHWHTSLWRTWHKAFRALARGAMSWIPHDNEDAQLLLLLSFFLFAHFELGVLNSSGCRLPPKYWDSNQCCHTMLDSRYSATWVSYFCALVVLHIDSALYTEHTYVLLKPGNIDTLHTEYGCMICIIYL